MKKYIIMLILLLSCRTVNEDIKTPEDYSDVVNKARAEAQEHEKAGNPYPETFKVLADKLDGCGKAQKLMYSQYQDSIASYREDADKSRKKSDELQTSLQSCKTSVAESDSRISKLEAKLLDYKMQRIWFWVGIGGLILLWLVWVFKDILITLGKQRIGL